VTGTRRSGLLAIAFGLAVVLARLPVALAHQDTWYPFEIQAGTIAQALLDGLDLDVATLPIVPHVRGSVLFGVLLVPIYALGGASSLTMKLLPILWHAATVALLVGLLGRYFTRRSVWSAGLLFLLAPPMIQKLSVLGLASHLESALAWLLTWGAYLAWTRDGATRGRALRFGAALGFAAFFHLQALLPSLLLLGLLVFHERRRILSSAGLWMLAGAAVCAAPSLLFAGGSIDLLRAGVFTQTQGSGPALAGGGRVDKFAGLCTGDLATALEFGGTAAPAGGWLGPLAVLGLALGALCGCLALRRAPLAVFFPLHAVLVAALYTVSELGVVAELGTGATNRHLAPLVVALLAFTAVGAAHSRLALIPVALVAAAGAIGYPAVVRGTDAARVRQRGECYEWFTQHLDRSAQGDAAAFAALLERIDRGDARFRSLRFQLEVPGMEAEATAFLSSLPGSAMDGRMTVDPAGLLRTTALGRRLAARLDALVEAVRAGRLDGLAPAAREALLHGVGLGLQPPRAASGLEPVRDYIARLGGRLAALPPDDVRAFAEGYGFQFGFTFDPYNRNLGEVLALHAQLDPQLGAAFTRGLAWGARQRFLRPPVAVPAGLAVVERLDPRHVPVFDEAFAGRVLPREASAFER
jgi:hypothetical protein